LRHPFRTRELLTTDHGRNWCKRTSLQHTVSKYFTPCDRLLHVSRPYSKLAKHRQGVSAFYFDDLFLASLRAGYLKRLDFDFCLHLDRQNKSLSRFLYAHILKRLGEKSVYTRRLLGFLSDIGMGYLAALPPRNRNQKVKQVVFPALELVKGQAFRQYELDDQGNIFFVHQ
jgi:hypothetical protein